MKQGMGIAIGVAIVVILGAIYYFLKRKPSDQDKTSIDIKIFDSQGEETPASSPALLAPGETYIVQVSVTNQSTQGGIATGAILTTNIEASMNGTVLIPAQSRTDNFGPGETLIFEWNLSVPAGLYGVAGNITVKVLSPLAKVIASATASIKVMEEITYGADIDIDTGGWNPWVYDTNGSGYIEISEQLDAVADYMSGLITLDQLNQVKVLYEGHIHRG